MGEVHLEIRVKALATPVRLLLSDELSETDSPFDGLVRPLPGFPVETECPTSGECQMESVTYPIYRGSPRRARN
jgi:hypothetical protein